MPSSDRFSLDQAGKYTGLSPQTLKLQAEHGRLAAEKVGGEWTTDMTALLSYLKDRRKNAGDVAVICLDCEQVYLNPSESRVVGGVAGPRILACPRCGSARMGIAATGADREQMPGHAIEAALRRVIDRAARHGSGIEELVDATEATIRIVASAGVQIAVSIEVDRDGEVDLRDKERLGGIFAAAVGSEPRLHGPDVVARYESRVDRPLDVIASRSSAMSDVRTGKPGTKYIRFTVDVWYQENDASIHITSPDDSRFHTTVNNTPGSKRQHTSLYRHLRRLLEAAHRWPQPAG